MTDVNLVYDRLQAVAIRLPAIERRQVQSFKAFNVDDIYAAIRPLLAEYDLVLVPSLISVEYGTGTFKGGTEYVDARIVMGYTFHCSTDGSKVEASFAAEGRDTQDKATNKAAQQALKYCLIQMFQINTGEDAEENPEPAPAMNPQAFHNQAVNHLVSLIGDEAKEAWPGVLEKAGLTVVETESAMDAAMAMSTELYGDAALGGGI